MTRRDARGNPVATASAAALDASERALWRMMSFYGTPIDDLDAAIAADPAWRLPRLMKAGFLLSLTEPSLAGDAAALLAEVAACRAPSTRASAPTSTPCSASPRATGPARAPPGARSSPTTRATRWRCSGRTCSTSTAATRRSSSRVPRPRSAAWPDDDPLHPYGLALHAFGLEESGRTTRPKPSAGVPSPPTRACPGRSTPSPMSWRCRAATKKARAGCRAARAVGRARRRWPRRRPQRLRRPPRLARGAVRARDARQRSRAAPLRRYLGPDDIEITLQRVDAASLLWRIALLGADVGERWRALLAGWRLDAATAGRSLFNDAHATLALIGAGELARASEWVALSLADAERQGGWNRAVMRRHRRAAAARPARLRRRPLRRRRRADRAAARAPGADRRQPRAARRRRPDVARRARTRRPARGGRALLDERRRAKPATPLTAHWARALAAPPSR